MPRTLARTLSVLVLLLLTSTARADIIYVDAAAAGANDGTTWTNAFIDLQLAIGASATGDDIWIAKGTYKPTSGTNSAIAFLVPVGVSLYGGFIGGETSLAQRPPDAFPESIDPGDTLLSGQIGGSGNSVNIVWLQQFGNSTFDRIVFAHAQYRQTGINFGRAVNLTGSSQGPLTFNDCLFTEILTSSSGAMRLGGSSAVAEFRRCAFIGINCADVSNSSPACVGIDSSSTATFTDCVFKQNTAFNGPACVSVWGSDADFIRCRFTDNVATGLNSDSDAIVFSATGGSLPTFASGEVRECEFSNNNKAGGIGVFNSTVSVYDSTFTNNRPKRGGGVQTSGTGSLLLSNCDFDTHSGVDDGATIYAPGLTVSMVDCTIRNSTAARNGGAVYLAGPGPHVFNNVAFENCVAGGDGGALWTNAEVLLNFCTFTDNRALQGGALVTGVPAATIYNTSFLANTTDGAAAAAFSSAGAPVFAGCVFHDNSGGWGPVFFGLGAAGPSFINCTLVGNVPNSSNMRVIDTAAPAYLANCIARDNTGTLLPPSATVRYSNIQGGWAGPGNISVDPLFTDAGDGDFTLQPASPCIDAGDSAAVPPNLSSDRNGNLRRFDFGAVPDSGIGPAPVVDMGAFEAFTPPPACAADANGDATVDAADLSVLLAQFGTRVPDGTGADFNNDGGVNGADLSILLSSFGQSCA